MFIHFSLVFLFLFWLVGELLYLKQAFLSCVWVVIEWLGMTGQKLLLVVLSSFLVVIKMEVVESIQYLVMVKKLVVLESLVLVEKMVP